MPEQPDYELVLQLVEGDEPRFIEAMKALGVLSQVRVNELAFAALLTAPLDRHPHLYAVLNGATSDGLIERLREGMRSEDQDVRFEAALAAARMAVYSDSTQRLKLLTLLSVLPLDDISALLTLGLSRLEMVAYTLFWDALFVTAPVQAARSLADAMDTHRDAGAAAYVLYRETSMELMISALAESQAISLAPILGLVARYLFDEGTIAIGPAAGLWERSIEAFIQAYIVSSTAEERALLVSGLEIMGQEALDYLAVQLELADDERANWLSQILADLHWEPEANLAGIRYWIHQDDFDACVAAGSLAIEPLRQVFAGTDLKRRDAAARTLDHLGWAPSDEEQVLPFLAALGRWDQLSLVTSRAGQVFEEMMATERRAALERNPAYRQGIRREMIARSQTLLSKAARLRLLRDALLADPSPLVRTDALDAIGEEGLTVELVRQSLSHELWLAVNGAEALADVDIRARLVDWLIEQVKALQDAASLEALLQVAVDDPEESLRERVTDSLLSMYSANTETLWPAIRRVLSRKEWRNAGYLLMAIGDEARERLIKDITDEAAEANRTALGLAAGILAGCDWLLSVDKLWFSDHPLRWEVAARVYDLCERYPLEPEMLAAYWITRGDLDECKRIGSAAVPALLRALAMAEPLDRGRIAAVMVEMGKAPGRKVLDDICADLQILAEMPDESVEQVVDAAPEHHVTLTVSREQDRLQARKLLARLGHEE